MAGVEDVTPEVRIEGADDVVADFQKMAASAVDSFAQIAQAAQGMGDIGKHISEVSETGKKSLGELGIIGAEAFGKILDAAGSGNFVPLISSFNKTAGAIAEVVQKATEFVESQAQVIETLSNLSTATGMTLSQIEGLKDAFASVGISAQGFERSIGRLAMTISNDWASIQQAVRTSSDQQAGSMLHMQETSLGVQKAYNAMNEAIDNASRVASHSAIAIQEASIGLRRAMEELNEFALKSQQNSLGIESATNSLERAKLNLAKDKGQDVRAQEKALKLKEDETAVSEAELRLKEAYNKKLKEGLELEESKLKVAKAAREEEEARKKAIEDSIKADQALAEAKINTQKAALANREAQEKQHELDLKDIPAIAKEIEAVAKGYKTWDEVANHAEISAQTLTKAMIQAASAGGKQPDSLAVFKEMMTVIPKVTDQGEKLAIVQHTMGAGFRAGGASAAQLLAIMERGTPALEKFMEEADKFSKVKIGGFDTFASEAARARGEFSNTEKAIKNFQGSLSGLDAAFDSLKARFAAIMAEPLTKLFDTMKESIYNDDGALRKLAESFADALVGIVNFLTEMGKSGALTEFGNAVVRFGSVLYDLGKAIAVVVAELLKLVGIDDAKTFFAYLTYACNLLKVSMDGLREIIAGIVIGFGYAVAAADKLHSMMPGVQSKTMDQALKDSAPLQAGKEMDRNAHADLTRDMKALDESGKKIQESANEHRKAAQDLSKSADKQGKVADKQLADKADKTDKPDASKNKILKDDDKSAQMNKDAAVLNKQAADKMETAAEAEVRQAGNTHGGSPGEDVFKPIAEELKQSAQGLDKSATATDSAADATKGSADAGKASAEDTKKAAAATDAVAAKNDKVADKWDTLAKVWDLVAKGLDEAVKGLVGLPKDAPGSGHPAPGKAAGGYISGSGTATSDSIPAWLSDGEYVMQASSVARYGKSFMDSVNKGVAKFADGGWVDSKFINSLQDRGQAYRGQATVSGGEASSHEEQAEFTLDTGNEGPVMINKTLAERAGIKATGKVALSGVSGAGEFETGQGEVAIQGVKRMTPLVIAPDGGPPNLIGMPWLNMLQDFAISKKTFLIEAATGGHIRGPGTATSDSIPARLSDGEYVMRASAVSQYGVPLFDALNNLALGGGARFAMGGPVGARGATLPTGLASEGPHSTLNLSIDGNHFNGLKAPEAVASKLKSYAVSRQASSAQNMPSWFR